MAEFAEVGDPTQLYMAIEKAYCEDRWPDVLEQGQKLLSRLPVDDLGLRQRLQLLLAHTHLYGYGNRESAGEFYRAVQESQAESSLRQIAAQGLQQCEVAPSPEPTTPYPDWAGPVIPWEEPSTQTAATPALPQSGATEREPLIPELIDEAELLEVHQADPALAEEFEIRETRPTAEIEGPKEDAELVKSLLKVELF